MTAEVDPVGDPQLVHQLEQGLPIGAAAEDDQQDSGMAGSEQGHGAQEEVDPLLAQQASGVDERRPLAMMELLRPGGPLDVVHMDAAGDELHPSAAALGG